MYLMYVDESGDCGLVNSPSSHFILTGLVIHESCWMTALEGLIGFRRRMKSKFGLKLREEIHTSQLITSPGPLARIRKNDRLAIIRHYADELASNDDFRVIDVVIRKDGKPPGYDVFDIAWQRLIQRFENTLNFQNFPRPLSTSENGMIFPDHTDDKKLTRLLRRMRRYNHVPYKAGSNSPTTSRNLTIEKIAEDPNFKNSEDSLFIQSADLAAYLLRQSLSANSYMKRKGGSAYFDRLEPILCTQASKSDPQGIVWV